MALFNKKIVPATVRWPSTEMTALFAYVKDNITSTLGEWQEFHSEKLPKYKKIYEGTPREETKSFPWRNASNIVVQVVGTHIDTMLARIISSIYELQPLWPISMIGTFPENAQAEEQRKALEEALDYCGLQDTELDFYRVQSMWTSDVLKFGFGVIKAPWERDIEVNYISTDGADSVATPIVKSDGPRPEKLNLANFAATWNAPKLDSSECRFKLHKISLTKDQLEERKYTKVYDSSAVDKILTKPDRGGPTSDEIEDATARGINPSSLYNKSYWDIYECWFPRWYNGQKYRIICTFHLSSETALRTVFNFYPDNDEPFVSAKMGYTTDGLVGRGFAEILKDYQEEVTTGHNQRVDNRTLANTAIIRVPKNSNFDSHFSFYPGMTLPGDKDEIEPMQVGAVYPNSVNEEMLTIKLAEDRAGSGPSSAGGGGLGSGTVGKTTGAYSAMGTYAVMQDANKRVSNITSDFKYGHIRAGRLFGNMYGHFDFGDRAKYFGERAEIIKKAFESLRQKKLGFSVKAATASINREIEKQNFLLLSGILQKHYTAVGQLIQAIQNPQIDPILKGYLINAAKAMNMIHDRVLIAFSVDDRKRILPDPFDNGQNSLTGAENERTQSAGGISPTTNGAPPDQQIPEQQQGADPSLSGIASLGANDNPIPQGNS